ncbi:MAG: hypothetical protein ABI435_06785, partial [Pseudolysinimonas sp.]
MRRISVATVAASSGAPMLARLIARTLAQHRSGRILYTTSDWQQYPAPSAERLEAAPRGTEPWLRIEGSAWIAAPELDDRYFDVAVADASAVTPASLPVLARSRDAVCLVTPPDRAAAEDAIAIAEQLTREGRRVVIAFDHTRPARMSWARVVTPRLVAPALTLDPDPGLVNPAIPLRSRAALRVAELAGLLMTDVTAADLPANDSVESR